MSFIHATETFYALEEETKKIPTVTNIADHNFIFDQDDLQELMSYYNEIELGFARLAEMGGIQGLSAALRTSLTGGLSGDELQPMTEDKYKLEGIERRKIQFGSNQITHPPGKTWLQLAGEELEDLMLRVLIICGFISMIVGAVEHPGDGWIDGLAILLAVVIVITVGATNNFKKEQQFRAMEIDSEKNTCIVIRNNNEVEVDYEDVVVGDLISVKQGDSIPCDCIYVLGTENWKTNESALTGETKEITKNKFLPFFMKGTEVAMGQGLLIACVVGDRTEYGQLMIKLRKPRENTPLQKKLEALGEMIGWGGTVVGILLFCILLVKWAAFQGASEPATHIVEYFIIGITVIVVAVPEGLPLAVTISLAYSMRKMMSDNNFVRVLSACETMGNATTICSDKTGTLTQNRMTVVKCHLNMKKWFQELPNSSNLNKSVYNILTKALVGNSTGVHKSDNNLTESELEGIKSGELKRPLVGDNSTGCAMLQWAIDMGIGNEFASLRRKIPIIKSFPFDSAVKRSSVLCQTSDNNECHVYTKGASEQILKICKYYLNSSGECEELTSNNRQEIEDCINLMTKSGLRCLGVCYKVMSYNDIKFSKNENGERTVKDEDSDNLFTDHIWITVCGIQDPVRPEVPNAVLTCQNAGIIVRMVTGDHLDTAKHIAKECHILTNNNHICMTGSQYRMLTEEEKFDKLPDLRVLARSKPSDKESLVRWYMEHNNDIVAVTGDGANDALALSEANVGLSMGRTGTDIAKKASDIVITDDNFASIVKTVMWGRSIYDNIKKFVQFQLTINFVALSLSLIGAFFSKYQNPLTPVQLLWVNLIMDTMAALALATEPPTMDLLKRNPYVRDGSLVSKLIWRFVIGHGTYQLVALLITMFAAESMLDIKDERYTKGEDKGRNPVLLSIIFNQFVYLQVFNEINARKVQNEHNVFDGFLQNPYFLFVIGITASFQTLIIELVGDFASTHPLTWDQWLYCISWGAGELIIGQFITCVPVDMEDGMLNVNTNELFYQDPDVCGEFYVDKITFNPKIGFEAVNTKTQIVTQN